MFAIGGWRLWLRSEAAAEADGYKAEKQFFGFSIVYLFLIFGLLLVEAVLSKAGLVPVPWLVLF
jgi:heme o synthase